MSWELGGYKLHHLCLRSDGQRQDFHHHRRPRALRRPRHHPALHLDDLYGAQQPHRLAILCAHLIPGDIQRHGLRPAGPQPRRQNVGRPSQGEHVGGRGWQYPHAQPQHAPCADGGGRAEPAVPGRHQPNHQRDPHEHGLLPQPLHLHAQHRGARGREGHREALQAEPGGPGGVGAREQDQRGRHHAGGGQVYQPLPALSRAGHHRAAGEEHGQVGPPHPVPQQYDDHSPARLAGRQLQNDHDCDRHDTERPNR
mmetsp:Transcript_5173/g.9416  ORF Transcript_5173/g.9416 Transcript_5173/m.9416 type:complete len:254 (+) Transcript_5173:378-1139(+)